MRLPPLLAADRWRYERAFAGNAYGAFRGVFETFAEAAASAPATRPLGYDNPLAAAMYADRPVFPEDYAVLFWLRSILEPGLVLFDYGGHAGGMYDAFARVLTLPEGFRWVIYDVPAVVEEGRRLSERKPRPHLSFTTDFAVAREADILLASGSLQYVDTPLAERLRELGRLPRHVLVNQVPLHDTREVVTLQNTATCYCPYRVFNRHAFLESLTHLGYELVDTWRNVAKGCFIPTYPDHSVEHYTGAYFRLR